MEERLERRLLQDLRSPVQQFVTAKVLVVIKIIQVLMHLHCAEGASVALLDLDYFRSILVAEETSAPFA